MPMTEPLTRGHQLFLQQLLAKHILSEEEAVELHEQVNDTRCASLQESFAVMNKQLSAGFNLEIGSVNMDGTRYHAIMNPHSDEAIAKGSFGETYTPHEKEFIRMALQHIVESSSKTRAELINLRMKLQEPFKDVSMDAAEHVLDCMLAENWLVFAEGSAQRRTSVAAEYQLGPRAYLELSSLLVEFGMPKEELPQFIFYRS